MGISVTAFYARYRTDGQGRTAFEPSVMLSVLLYAYCVGERSSRQIERLCRQDVAYRVLCVNEIPDHVTIARFRKNNEVALAAIFLQVLELCGKAGMVNVGLIALDGTKLMAAASKSENRQRHQLEAEIAGILADAATVDDSENAEHGAGRGDELPSELADPRTRKARIAKALEQLDTERDTRRDARGELLAEFEKRPSNLRGRKPKIDKAEPEERRANVTDPDSRTMKSNGVFVQGYNGQAVVTKDQIVLAAELTQDPADCAQFVPMIESVKENLEATNIDATIGTVVADAGYYSADNATAELGAELLIAPQAAKNLGDGTPTQYVQHKQADITKRLAEGKKEINRRETILNQLIAGETTPTEAATELGMTQGSVSRLKHNYIETGRAGIKPNFSRRLTGEYKIKRTQQVRLDMEQKLTTDDGRNKYKLRCQTIEPVFGQIKEARGIRRFARRGLDACDSEWKLITATHNLLKLWKYGTITT